DGHGFALGEDEAVAFLLGDSAVTARVAVRYNRVCAVNFCILSSFLIGQRLEDTICLFNNGSRVFSRTERGDTNGHTWCGTFFSVGDCLYPRTLEPCKSRSLRAINGLAFGGTQVAGLDQSRAFSKRHKGSRLVE